MILSYFCFTFIILYIHFSLIGDQEVSVIRSCRCGDAGRCRRLRKTVVYYPVSSHTPMLPYTHTSHAHTFILHIPILSYGQTFILPYFCHAPILYIQQYYHISYVFIFILTCTHRSILHTSIHSYFHLSYCSQGTEYEVAMDVGQCSSEGGCGPSETCEPVEYDLKTIISPDG